MLERSEWIFLKSWTIFKTSIFLFSRRSWRLAILMSLSDCLAVLRFPPSSMRSSIWFYSYMYSLLSSSRSEWIYPKLLTMARTCSLVLSYLFLSFSIAAVVYSSVCFLASAWSFFDASSPALIPARVALFIFSTASFSALAFAYLSSMNTLFFLWLLCSSTTILSSPTMLLARSWALMNSSSSSCYVFWWVFSF